MESNSYLKTIKLSGLNNWSVQYLLQNTFSYNEDFDLVSIGDFLERNKTGIEIQDNEHYKRVTIKVRNGGVFLRDIQKGDKIGTKKQFSVKKGQFLLSKIDARNGAFGVIPEEVDNAIITGNFWTFDVDYNKINPHFLSLIVTTPEFIRFCENASNGTTNRHYLQEDLFLEQKIPLPLIDEQDNIVKAYNKKISLAEKQEQKAKDLEQEIEEYIFDALGIEKLEEEKQPKFRTINFKDVDRWSVDTLGVISKIEERFNGYFKLVKFRKLIHSCQYGLSEKSSKDKIGIPMLRMNNINNSNLNIKDLKYIAIDENQFSKYKLVSGDLLFNRTNSKELVGKTAVFDIDNEDYTFASYLIRVKINDELANVNYINYLFNSTILKYQKNLVSRQITGQANINAQEMQDFLFPLPSIDVQNKIADHISEKKAQIKTLNKQAKLNREQAILDFEKEIFS